MFKKTGLTALVLAVVLLFSCVSFAEGDSSKFYLRLENPYFTDGETVYDLNGMKVDLQISNSPTFEQLLLSVITAKGTARAAIETQPDAVSIYGDGFSSSYTMTPEYMAQIINERFGFLKDVKIDTTELLNKITELGFVEMPAFPLKETIDAVYVKYLESLSVPLESAHKDTVDTFVYTDIEAKVIDFEITPEQIDEVLLKAVNQLDALVMSGSNPAFNEIKQYGSLVNAYESVFEPINLSLKGKIYVCDNGIYTVCGIYSLDELLTTAYVEVLSKIASAIYVNVPVVDDNGSKLTFYITAEANTKGDGSERYESGIMAGDMPMFLTYIEHMGEDFETYFGFASGSSFIEIDEKLSTDQKTYRDMLVALNLNGMMYELNYDGTITISEDEQNERADFSLTSNTGIAAKGVIEFGTAPFDAESIIPSADSVPAVKLDDMTPEQNAQLSVDFSNLLTQTIIILQYGVPGFSTLLSRITQSVG